MDNAYEQRKQELIEEITAAFDGVVREDGVSLHEAMVIDDYGSDEERAQARAQDTEARWQDVPDEDIGWRSDVVLSFLDAKGFRYYLPAYLVWFLKHTDSEDDKFAGSSTFSSVLFRLNAKHKNFTPEQSRAIAHFLVLQAEREGKWNSEDAERLKAEVAGGELSQEQADDFLSRTAITDAQDALKRFSSGLIVALAVVR